MLTTMFTAKETKTPRIRNGTQVAGITVTVKESESHTYTANLTKLALESGSIVTDHMILEPVSVAVSFSATNAGQGRQAAKDIFDAFVNLQTTRTLIELVTEHAVYSNMALTSLTPMHSAPYKGTITCTATFEQVNFVALVSAGRAPSQLKGPAKKTAAGQTQAGKVEPIEKPKSNAAKIASRRPGLMPPTKS